ncbi:hypothetical protein P8452_04525 [Trifolium repens]|nr:hypothetical protein P8452_04525 [Trifolium repens]
MTPSHDTQISHTIQHISWKVYGNSLTNSKLASNVEFLFGSHGGAGGLFSVTEGRVKDADIRGVSLGMDVVGDGRRTVTRGLDIL